MSEVCDAAAQLSRLGAVVLGDLAVGGGAVVGAGAAHPLGLGEAEDEHAVGEQEVEEL